MMKRCAALGMMLMAAGVGHAEVVRYVLTGTVGVGTTSHPFHGVFSYENQSPGSTVYLPGNGPGSLQGFVSIYPEVVREFWIELDNGDRVTAPQGQIDVNNIEQAEAGAPLPEGLTLQVYPSGTTGTIDGVVIRYMYLAFLPVPSNFSWDALDAYFNGNAEHILQNDPSALPADIDPSLTGSALPQELLTVFNGGVFLGTVYDTTTLVNTIWTFELAPQECSADFNSDGQLNFFDVQAFLSLFASQDPSADMTGDGLFDFFDVQEFLGLFAGGCP